MIYALMGWLHASALTAGDRLHRGQRGQGTVEYVGLILLLAVVLAGVVMAAKSLKGENAIPTAIINKLKGAIGHVDFGK